MHCCLDRPWLIPTNYIARAEGSYCCHLLTRIKTRMRSRIVVLRQDYIEMLITLKCHRAGILLIQGQNTPKPFGMSKAGKLWSSLYKRPSLNSLNTLLKRGCRESLVGRVRGEGGTLTHCEQLWRKMCCNPGLQLLRTLSNTSLPL